MRGAVAVAVLLLTIGMQGAKAGGDRIWSALLLATKEDPPGPVPKALEKFAPSIRKIFGYNSLYLLGEKKRDLISGGEEWLVPSKEFFFKVQCLSQGGDILFAAHRVVSRQESPGDDRGETGPGRSALHPRACMGEGAFDLRARGSVTRVISRQERARQTTCISGGL